MSATMVGRQRKFFRLEALKQSFECIEIKIKTVKKLLHNVVYFSKPFFSTSRKCNDDEGA